MTDRVRPLAPTEIIDDTYYAEHGYPHAAWRRMRRDNPVAWCETERFPGFWAITKYDDIVRLSTDPKRFLNAPIMAVFPREQYEADSFPFRHLINMDPPEHRQYRRILASEFTPRAVLRWTQDIETTVDECLSAIADKKTIDFVSDVSAVMPLAVIADMLGIPRADRETFFHWTNLAIAGVDEEYRRDQSTEDAVRGAFEEMFAYFGHMVAERRKKPTDDMTSIVANAELGDQYLPEWELLSYMALLVVAGNETTRNAATGGMLELLRNPEQFDKLRTNHGLVDSAVEEIVRWTTPVNQFCRTSIEDIELRGVSIPAGEPMCLFYASANRDEDLFDDPDDFRVDRQPNPHIAFGVGEHVCMGAHLARLELRTLFSRLAARLKHAELAGPIVRQQSSFVGGIKHLPMTIEL